MGKNAHLYVLDTLADWEPGYLIAELNSGRYFAEPGSALPVRTVGATTAAVRTKGGLALTPDLAVADLDPADSAILILPGGDTWLEPTHVPIMAKAREFLAAGVPVAAICGATIALAQAGLLDDRPHTSNDPGALAQFAPNYRGGAHYVAAPAVVDGDLITATGTAPVEFARAALDRLGVLRPSTLDAWHRLQTERSTESFVALMDSLPTPA